MSDGKNKETRRDAGKDERRNVENSERRRHRGSGVAQFADFRELDASLLVGAIIAVTRTGCALQLGITKDGGAFVFRFVGDGDTPYNEFVRAADDTSLYLTGVIESFQ